MLKLGPDGRSRLGVLGQLRQVLISILMDHHERLVPNVMEWELTECDLNKDVKVSGSFHFTGLKIQVKHTIKYSFGSAKTKLNDQRLSW
jgi:hypothetical protein